MRILPKKPFTWVLLALLAYAYISSPDAGDVKDEIKDKVENTFGENKLKPKVKTSDNDGGFLSNSLDGVVDRIRETKTGSAVINAIAKQALEEKYGDVDLTSITAQHQNKVITLDRIKGEGAEARCGSIITLQYKATIDDSVIFDKSEEPLVYKMGDQKIIAGLEEGLLGMKKGGKRKIAVPSRLAYDVPEFRSDLVPLNKPVLFEVEAFNIENGQEPSKSVMSIENIKPSSDANGKQLICGDNVKINYKLAGSESEYKEVSFLMDGKSIPIGLEKGIVGMKKGSVRRVNIPKDLWVANGIENVIDLDEEQLSKKKISLEIELVDFNN